MTRDELLANLRRIRAWDAWKDGDPWPERVRTADRTATLDEAILVLERRERIACGSTDPDPGVEALIVEMRANIDAPKGFDGCGGAGVWSYMYRCVECGRWMHKGCILKHFESHRTLPASDSAASNEGAKREDWIEDVTVDEISEPMPRDWPNA